MKSKLSKPDRIQRRIMPSQLRFQIEPHWPNKSTMFERWIARRAASRILNGDARTYQFGGFTGALKLSYELVNADKEQIAHWLLRDVGYNCCTADIMELTGNNENGKIT